MIELGRNDIIMEVLLLSSHVAHPREGHLEAAVHVMAHIDQRYNSKLVHNPSYLEVDHSVFKKCDRFLRGCKGGNTCECIRTSR